MASIYQKLEVQKGEKIIDIPDNKLAKLMYYLECVFTVIKSDIHKRYTNYNNYYLISKLEEQTILNLVSTFNLKVMKELNLFIIEPISLPNNKENEFYDISNERFKGKIKSEVNIDEVTRKVLKIMVCTQSWINKYYEEPLNEYENLREIDINISDNLFNKNKNGLNFEKFKNICCENNSYLCCIFRNLVEWTVGLIAIIVAFIFIILYIIYFLHDQHIIK